MCQWNDEIAATVSVEIQHRAVEQVGGQAGNGPEEPAAPPGNDLADAGVLVAGTFRRDADDVGNTVPVQVTGEGVLLENAGRLPGPRRGAYGTGKSGEGDALVET